MRKKSVRKVRHFNSKRFSFTAQSASHLVASDGSLIACQSAAIKCDLP